MAVLTVAVDPDQKVAETDAPNNALRLRLTLPSRWPADGDEPLFLPCRAA